MTKKINQVEIEYDYGWSENAAKRAIEAEEDLVSQGWNGCVSAGDLHLKDETWSDFHNDEDQTLGIVWVIVMFLSFSVLIGAVALGTLF